VQAAAHSVETIVVAENNIGVLNKHRRMRSTPTKNDPVTDLFIIPYMMPCRKSHFWKFRPAATGPRIEISK
jgi:hypothetical protein